jgi:anti-sigma factor RsiW
MPRFRLPWRRHGAPPPGLACQEIVELVTAYVEGTLDVADAARFEAHIAGCDACTMYVAQMRATIATLGRIPAESLSPHVAAELELAFADWNAGR